MSPLAVATRVPSGLNATAHTGPSWSSRASVLGCRRRTLRSSQVALHGRLGEDRLCAQRKCDDHRRACGAQRQFRFGGQAKRFGAACGCFRLVSRGLGAVTGVTQLA